LGRVSPSRLRRVFFCLSLFIPVLFFPSVSRDHVEQLFNRNCKDAEHQMTKAFPMSLDPNIPTV